MSVLPAAPPSVLDDRGEPRFGGFEGHLSAVRWDGLRGRHARGSLWRMLHGKRWHYVGILGPRVIAAAAVVDLGWTAARLSRRR